MNETELKELDAWIAEHVFGLKINANGMIETWPRPNERHDECVADYTTESAAAMQVLEKCGERSWPTVYKSRADGSWCIDNQTITGDRKVKIICTAETLPLAICKFAKHLYSEKSLATDRAKP